MTQYSIDTSVFISSSFPRIKAIGTSKRGQETVVAAVPAASFGCRRYACVYKSTGCAWTPALQLLLVPPPGPNNIEKTTNTCARGESSVQPKSGETSKRVLLVGFHAIVGPITKLLSGWPRVSLSVKLRYSISTPVLSRSCSSQIGVIALCANPHSRPRSPPISCSKNQFIAHSIRSPKSSASKV